MHGRGVCMAGGHVKQGVCMAGGMCVEGGVHGRGRAWYTRRPRYHEIRSMSGWYASYWNVFLFPFTFNGANFH